MAIATRRTDPMLRGRPQPVLSWEVEAAPKLGTFSILRDGRLHTRLGGTPQQGQIRTERLFVEAPRHHWCCIDEIGGILMSVGGAGLRRPRGM